MSPVCLATAVHRARTCGISCQRRKQQQLPKRSPSAAPLCKERSLHLSLLRTNHHGKTVQPLPETKPRPIECSISRGIRTISRGARANRTRGVLCGCSASRGLRTNLAGGVLCSLHGPEFKTQYLKALLSLLRQVSCLPPEGVDAHVVVHLLLQVGHLRHRFGLGRQRVAVQRLQVRQVYGGVRGIVTQLGDGAGPPIWITEQQQGQLGKACQVPHLQSCVCGQRQHEHARYEALEAQVLNHVATSRRKTTRAMW